MSASQILPFSQFIMTTIIAVLGGSIAYRQWQTAKQKLVLDLFERRFDAYQHICTGCMIFTQSGVMDEDAHRSLAKGVSQVRFLFGRDVETEIEAFWRDALWMIGYERRYEASPSDSQLRMDERREKFFDQANQLLTAKIFLPYMKLDTRLR